MPLESIREEETDRGNNEKKGQVKYRLQPRPLTASRKTFTGKKQTHTPERKGMMKNPYKPTQYLRPAKTTATLPKPKQRP